MTRLTWGDPGTRFYETGVDRGVLYVDVANGVAWSGLTGVSENPTGGEAKPRYIDGRKFRNTASSEEFEATIEAFSAPPEFAACDGTASIYNGLFATQQPRRAFGFSYRTLIGNDTEGSDPAYKIHLVYNALAAPSSRQNASMSDTPSPLNLSWAITTLPKSLSGSKPTAHFVIDSRYTPKGLLNAVEDILYGSNAAAPRLPMPSELSTLFKSEGPVLRTNLAVNGSFRYSQSPSAIRTNFAVDPRLITASGWVGVGAGGVVSQTSVYSPNQSTVPNNVWAVSIEVTAPAGTTITGTISSAPTTGGTFGTNPRGSSSFTVPAGEMRRVSNVYVVPAGCDGVRLLLSLSSTTGVKLDRAMLERSAVVLPYFDGSFVEKNLATGRSFASLGNNSTVTPNISQDGKVWTRLSRAAPSGYGFRMSGLTEINDGDTVTFSALYKNDSDVPVSFTPEFSDLFQPGDPTKTLEPGETRRIFVTGSRVTYSNGVMKFVDVELAQVGTSILITDVLVEKGSYVNDYYAGTASSLSITYAWAASANASVSYMNAPRVGIGSTGYDKSIDAYPSEVWLWKTQGFSPSGDGIAACYPGASQNSLAIFGYSPLFIPATIGDYFACRFKARIIPGAIAGDRQITPRLTNYPGATPYLTNAPTIVLTTAWTEVELASTNPTPAGKDSCAFMIYKGNNVWGDERLEICDVLIERVSGPDMLPRSYFSGETPDREGYFYNWAGLLGQSASTMRTWHLI